MSEQAFNGYYGAVGQVPRTGLATVLTNWAGAIISICLVLGLGVWSYQLTMRDVTEVPVIRAMEGKFRERPETPGGEVAENRGLAVNVVQSEGGVQAPADRLLLAPDPVNLSDEDVPLAYLRPNPRDVSLDPEPLNLRDVSAVEGETDADAINAAVLAAVRDSATSEDLAKIARLPGVKRSPRPKARTLVAALATGSGTSVLSDVAVEAGPVDIDPSEVLAGTRLVQLGAFDDRDSAIREWRHIIDRHGDLIGARKRLVQVAESGGRSFYRLRMVGFESLSDSRRLCSALLARGTPCIPVTAR